MGKLGGRCRAIPPEFAAALEDGTANVEDFDPDAEDADNELLIAGRAWCPRGQRGCRRCVPRLADEMISAGEAEEVSETCQQLMGETSDRRVSDELGAIFDSHQKAMLPAPSRLGRMLGGLIGR